MIKLSTKLSKYLLAIGSTLFIVALKSAITSLLIEESPFLLFSLAIFISTYFGDASAGILALIISVLASDLLFLGAGKLEVITSLETGQWSSTIRLILFIAEGIAIVAFVNKLRKNEAKLLELSQTLEQRVEERTLQIQAKNQLILEANQIKDNFISNISHEMRSPLFNMLMCIDALRAGKSKLDYIDILDSECRKEIAFVNDLLDLQILESQGSQIKLSCIELSQWLEFIIEPYRERGSKAGIYFEIHPINETWIETDAAKLERILGELLTNALKYTKPGGFVQIDLIYEKVNQRNEAKREDENNEEKQEGREELHEIVLSVSNSGKIESDALPKIFDKFYRVPNSTASGTGLGLALVKGLIQSLGGQINVTSSTGIVCFSVTLPLKYQGFIANEIKQPDQLEEKD